MILTKHLKAALAILDKPLANRTLGHKDVVRIEPHRIVACNGPALIVIATEAVQCATAFHVDARLLGDVLKGWGAAEVSVDIDSPLNVDVRYPDYRAVLRRYASGVPSQFQTEYLVRFARAAKILTCNPYFAITHNGENAAVISFPLPYVTGVLQPIRMPEVRQVSPDWAFE